VAIAQRQLVPRSLARPEPRVLRKPALRAPTIAKSPTALRPLLRQLAIAAGLAIALIAYVYGYALMTAANYQRVKLNATLGSLRSQQQLLSSAVIQQRNKSVIDQWAAANRFTRETAKPVVIARSQKGLR
jgi:hypothetical protein